MSGTTLVVPRRRLDYRVTGVAVALGAGVSAFVEILDGSGDLAQRVAYPNEASTLSLNVGLAAETGGIPLPGLPPDFWVSPTDSLQIVASGTVNAPVVISFEEEE